MVGGGCQRENVGAFQMPECDRRFPACLRLLRKAQLGVDVRTNGATEVIQLRSPDTLAIRRGCVTAVSGHSAPVHHTTMAGNSMMPEAIHTD